MFTDKKITAIKQTVRTSKYELLRFIAAFLVIWYHASTEPGSSGNTNWFFLNMSSLFVMPVALFIFITGFFTANSTKTRIFKFLWIVLIYYLLNLVVNALIVHFNGVPKGWIDMKVITTYGGVQWWYLWTLPFLYLLSPIINLALKTINKWYMLAIIIVFYFVYLFTSRIEYYPALIAPGQIMFFVSVYSLGAWWKLNSSSLGIQKLGLLCAIIYLLIIQVVNNIVFATKGENVYYIIQGKDTSTVFTVLAAMSFFIIFQNIHFIKFSKFINFLGQLSLPIYLFHIMFLTLDNSFVWTPGGHVDLTNTWPIINSGGRALVAMAFSTVFGAIFVWPMNQCVKYGNWCTDLLINYLKVFLISQKNKLFKKPVQTKNA